MRTLRLVNLAAAIVLASGAPVCAQQEQEMSPALVSQLQDVKVQEQLIALGVLDAKAGQASSKDLAKAVDWFRKANKSTRGMAPLDDDEKTKLKQAKDGFDAATGLKELTYQNPNTKTDIKLFVPLKFVGESPEKLHANASDDGWREYRSQDGKTAVGPVIRLLSDVTPIALFRENIMRVSLDYKYLHLSSEEFTAVGSTDDSGGYFSANMVLTAKDKLEGLIMRYPKSPPKDTFLEVPDFLVPLVGSAPESKAQAWQLLMQGFANLAMSEFPRRNGWKVVDATPCSHRPKNVGPESIRVFFGTDRKEKPTAPTKRDQAGPVADPDSLFANEPGNKLQLGCAYVVPPPIEEVKKTSDLAQGKITWYQPLYSTPPADFGDQLFLANELAESAQTVSRSRTRIRILRRARDASAETSSNSALVFIHGYNVSFKDALFTVAQIASNTDYRGRVYLYSWPSAASMFGYVADMDNAEQAEPFLRSFLKLLMRDADIDDIDVLVHSMGSQPTLRALSALQSVFETERQNGRKIRIGQIIFAAPDVSSPVFDQKIRRIAPHADRVTVYASLTDAALLASKILRSGASRLGQLDENKQPLLVEVEHVHMINATGPEPWWRLDRILKGYGHDYFLQSNGVRADIGKILGPSETDDTETPERRSNCFEKKPFRQNAERSYWVLKDQCLQAKK